MSESAIEELLHLNQRLLDSIDQQDWNAYQQLCEPTLTAFEPDALGHRVAGMAFHHFYFKLEASGRPQQSTISSPQVRLMGNVAVVTYIRLKQSVDAANVPHTQAAEETRVWEKKDGVWKHVHFHRSISASL